MSGLSFKFCSVIHLLGSTQSSSADIEDTLFPSTSTHFGINGYTVGSPEFLSGSLYTVYFADSTIVS